MTEQLHQPAETSFIFVLCEHVPENAEAIAQPLIDCDIIAFEGVGMKEDHRRGLERLLDIYTTGTSSEEVRSIIEDELPKNITPSTARLWLGILRQFPGSDKRSVIVDVSEDHEAYRMVQASREGDAHYYDGLLDSVPRKVLEATLTDKLYRNARSFRAREDVVADQLTVLAQKNPGARIGVVIGAAHSGVQHTIDKTFETEREFVGHGTHAAENIRYTHNLTTDVIRQLHFGTRKTIGEKTVKAVLLQDLIRGVYRADVNQELLGEMDVPEMDMMIMVLRTELRKAFDKK